MTEIERKIYYQLASNVLSSWLYHSKKFEDKDLKLLDIDLFIDENHKNIAKAIHHLIGIQEVLDPISVCLFLRKKQLSNLETEAFLIKIQDENKHFSFYRDIKVLQDQRFTRETTQKLKNLVNEFKDNPHSINGSLKKLQEELTANNLENKGSLLSDVTTLKVALKQLEESKDKDIERKDNLRSVGSTLDKKAYLFEKGTLTTIAARPGIGKTTFAINLIANNLDFIKTKEESKELQPAIAIVSLEARNKDTLITLIAIRSGVDLYDVRDYFNGKEINRDLEDRIKRTQEEIEDCNLLLSDNPNLDINGICEWVRKCSTKYQIKFVVIDHLQLVKTGKNRKEENLNLDVGGVSRDLKKIALELDICFIALSQLNRRIEIRGKESSKPMLSDLRDSGGVEQDSDVVIFLTKNKEDEEMVNLFILKNRRGVLSEFGLRFYKNKGKFA